MWGKQDSPGLSQHTRHTKTEWIVFSVVMCRRERNWLLVSDSVVTVVLGFSRWTAEALKAFWQTHGPPSWRPGWCVVQETLTSSTTTWSRQWCWQHRTGGRGSCTASFPTHGELEHVTSFCSLFGWRICAWKIWSLCASISQEACLCCILHNYA